MEIVTVGLGVLLLVLGRKLFWLGVAALGFFLGMAFTGALLVDQPTWVRLLMGLGAGLLGAMVVILTQRAAFAFAGFCAGAYLALIAAPSFGGGSQGALWLAAGGIIGAVLAVLIMDWAIIALTSVVGASAIVDAGSMGQTTAALLFVVLTGVGIVVQARLMGRRPAKGHLSAK